MLNSLLASDEADEATDIVSSVSGERILRLELCGV